MIPLLPAALLWVVAYFGLCGVLILVGRDRKAP